MDATRLIFEWSNRRRLSATLLGFLALSFAVHAFAFYLFQVVYPPAIGGTARGAEIMLLTPSSPENRELLARIESEDPAKILAPPDVSPAGLLDLRYKPSYEALQPEPVSAPAADEATAYPPILEANALVSAALPRPKPKTEKVSPSKTHLSFSGALVARELRKKPVLFLKVRSAQAIEPARFLIGVDAAGIVRYSFLQSSSGDEQADREAEHAVQTLEFVPVTSNGPAVWGSATLIWGADAFTGAPAEQKP